MPPSNRSKTRMKTNPLVRVVEETQEKDADLGIPGGVYTKHQPMTDGD